MRVVRIAALLMSVMCAGFFGSAIYQASLYHAAQTQRQDEFSQRVNLAMADNDVGGGAYTQVDGAFLCNNSGVFGPCNPISSALTFSNATPFTFTAGMTGSLTFAAGVSGAATANLTINSTDTNCTGTPANLLLLIQAIIKINCAGKMTTTGGLAVNASALTTNNNGATSEQFGGHFAGNDGTACAGPTPLTCDGPVVVITAAAGTATITYATAWLGPSNIPHGICRDLTTAANTATLGFTDTRASEIISVVGASDQLACWIVGANGI